MVLFETRYCPRCGSSDLEKVGEKISYGRYESNNIICDFCGLSEKTHTFVHQWEFDRKFEMEKHKKELRECYLKRLSLEKNIIEKLDVSYYNEFFILGSKENLDNENVKSLIDGVNDKHGFIKFTLLKVDSNLLCNKDEIYIVKKETPISLYFE